jgi:hypothetical protein
MGKMEQVTIQEQKRKPQLKPLQKREVRANVLEMLLKKVTLAALTMLGIGYVLVNVPIALLIADAMMNIPISSQANVNALAGRGLFIAASTIAAVLGVLVIYGAVQFYEHSKIKGTVFLGVLLGSFYLLCLGAGSTILLPEMNVLASLLIVSPTLVALSATMHTSSDTRLKLFGSILGIASGVTLAYVIFNFKPLSLVFEWNVPFTGPFLSMTVLESMAIILGSVAACVNSLLDHLYEARPFAHATALLVALVYGLGAFIGSLVVSMSFWNLIWKSPWLGPFYGISEWVTSTIVFWSASLVLMDIGGILLIAAACLGLMRVAREFSKF